MSEQSTVVVICAMIVAIGQILVAWISHRTHRAVNSRMTDFLKSAEEKFGALGELRGAQDERQRQEKAKPGEGPEINTP